MNELCLTLDEARSLDANDPIASLREQFQLPQPGTEPCVYFCGHSLGPLPRHAHATAAKEFDQWGRLGVEGHFHEANPWYSYHEQLAPAMARLVGAEPSEVVCMNSLTTNLHLLFVSFYRPTRKRYRILSEGGMFPSDRYLLETQVRFHGFDPDDAIIEIEPRAGEHAIRDEDLLAAIEEAGDELALVFLGGVNYLSGQRFDLAAAAAAARRVGAVCGVDLAHAAGNVPLELHDWDIDFAAWCTYKYLNAGPGNVGAVFVHERHGHSFDLPRFGGWWGHDKERRFLMEKGFTPIPGAEGWQLSNAPIISMAVLKASLELFDRVGMAALRKKSVKLTAYLETALAALAAEFPAARIEQITPAEPELRGAQLSFTVGDRSRDLFDQLMAAGVVGDFREPNRLRLAPIPSYNTFSEVFRFYAVMRKLLA